MDGTAVSVVQPLPGRVNPSSTRRSTSTRVTVTSIDQTSWKAGKRSRITSPPSSTTYNASSTPPSLQITKTNNSKGYGSKLSPSSLIKPSPRKRRRLAADVVTSVAAVTTTSDDLWHNPSDASWDHPVPSGPPGYALEPIVSDAARDHFSLSSRTLAQEQGPHAYDWPYNFNRLTSSGSSSQPSLFPSPLPPYLTTQGPSSYHNIPADYLAYHTLATTPNYPVYPLPPFGLNGLNTPDMLLEYRLRRDSGVSSQERKPPWSGPLPLRGRDIGNPDEALEEGWIEVERPVDVPVEVPTEELVKRDSASDYDSIRESPNLSEEGSPRLEESSWEAVGKYDIPQDRNSPTPHPEGRSRSHLSDQHRKETGNTRKLKCKADPEDPRGVDCLTCRDINLDSKKVIHRLQCLRWKLAEVILFRDGGLELTKRWVGTKMKDLGPRDWVHSSEFRTIKIVMGSSHPMVLKVKKFTPNETDITWKNWVDAKGDKHRIDIEPYALASIWETSRSYEEYLYDYARSAVREYANDLKVAELVRTTYRAALDYAQSCKDMSPRIRIEEIKNGILLEQYFYLWFATRNTLRSAFIVGEETLDMKPIDNIECPYHGTIPVPRMIPAQFDSLGHRILTRSRKLVLENLWKVMAGKNPHHFYFVYLTVFMLLHEASFTCADRLRRAKENKYAKYRYDLAKFVEELQEGANNILSHWHYYKRDVNDLMPEAGSEDKKNAVWGTLKANETSLLVETRNAYGQLAGDSLEWEDDLYFVSQMFEENWRPGKTFSR
ncbi:uncharacterized protein F4812DRAFT_447059 [Daldinia caldariorum]|uniref:uncharacterized protein n=1 Tax=Daldinia caldariorum TaxID=326644 RepID=UPI0020074B7C|nr:uncharacterized protein F4812DRAFT_447059 [Daldinia caldariorum]KAI1463452.1 hypothetical protein F4812DRAFT_447059 [Daldinia caldariorum]